MNDKHLLVGLPGRSVGALTQDRDGMVRWTPDVAWDLNQDPKLGLDFLRTRGPRSHASELPAWFENLLPEQESELRRRLCQVHGLREGQSFALLRALGSDLIGAVTVFAERSSEPILAAPPDTDAEPLERRGPGERISALTGMQLKFSMSMVNERLVLAARGGGSQWIVKIAGEQYEELAEVEHCTMRWARASGLAVPDHFVVPLSKLDGIPDGWIERDAPAFAVRRFDRREDGSRIHQEDLCQALALRPRDKYGDGKHVVSFEGALRLVTDACGEADGRDMARRIGFMIACGNTDAHLKNWSLLWGERTRPTLTPCYDLVSTIAWEPLGWSRKGGPELALTLGGERNFRLLAPHTLSSFGERSGLIWAREEIELGIDLAREAWRTEKDSAPARMREAVEQHWKRVPLLAQRQAQ